MDDQRWLRRIVRLWTSAQKQDPKPKWQILIESTGGAALITVLLGGIAGGLITARYQSKQAELQRDREKQERMEQLRFAASKNGFDLIFATIAAAEDIINLSSKDMYRAPKEQREKIRSAYNIADANWRRLRPVVGVTMAYYSPDQRAAATAWTVASDYVTKYSDCAAHWLGLHPYYLQNLQNGCTEERKKVDEGVSALQIQVLGPR